LYEEIKRAFAAFVAEVEARTFPASEHTVDLPEEEWQAFLDELHVSEPY